MTAKIAISLPEELLREIDERCRMTAESRSRFLRRVVEVFLQREREQEAVQRYIEGYRKYPETGEEVALSEASLKEVLAENPWEDESGS